MRFLADMGVARSTVRALRGRGHDVLHLQEAGLRQLPDDAILDKARQDNRVILSFDLDFGDLLATGLYDRPSVVIFRLRNQTPASVTPRLLEVLSETPQDWSRVLSSSWKMRDTESVASPSGGGSSSSSLSCLRPRPDASPGILFPAPS